VKEAEAGESAAEGRGRMNTGTINAANACHSFLEADEGEAGVTGPRCSADFAQQPPMQHLPCVEQQHGEAPEAGSPVGAATALCQTVTKATTIVSIAVTALASRLDTTFVSLPVCKQLALSMGQYVLC
jgi:hypothetical protein